MKAAFLARDIAVIAQYPKWYLQNAPAINQYVVTIFDFAPDIISGIGFNLMGKKSGKYSPNENGYYGVKGQGGNLTRNEYGGINEAEILYNQLIDGKGYIYYQDDQRVVFRKKSSSDGTCCRNSWGGNA